MHTFLTSRRILSALAVSLGAVSAYSFAQAESEFDKAAPTADEVVAPIVMTEANKQRLLSEIVGRDCDKTGKCFLTGIDSEGSGWTFSCNAGVGARNYGSGTTVINVGDEDVSNRNNDPYYGCSVTLRDTKCSTKVIVSKAMKIRFETNALSGLNANGTQNRTQTPTEVALDSLYATLQSKLDSCRLGNQ